MSNFNKTMKKPTAELDSGQVATRRYVEAWRARMAFLDARAKRNDAARAARGEVFTDWPFK